MKTNLTFSMIKPDAVNKNYIGEIIKYIIDNGFIIKALKMTRLSIYEARKFYEIHKDKEFYNELVEFMISGPIVALILEKDNAVEDFRKLIGSTNPEIAEKGTIRKLFAESIRHNAIHGSDSNENAQIESNFHFSEREIIN